MSRCPESFKHVFLQPLLADTVSSNCKEFEIKMAHRRLSDDTGDGCGWEDPKDPPRCPWRRCEWSRTSQFPAPIRPHFGAVPGACTPTMQSL